MSIQTKDLSNGWFATIQREDDGHVSSLTLRNPDIGHRVTLNADEAQRLIVMIQSGEANAARDAYQHA